MFKSGANPFEVSTEAMFAKTEAINSELAVAKNQTPIINPTILTGDNFVTAESPTGDKLNSPQVCNKYVKINQKAATLPVSEILIPKTKEPKPNPTKIKASENFTAVLGLYFPSLTHNQAKTGANKIINKALKLKNYPADNSIPKIFLSKILSANKFIEV